MWEHLKSFIEKDLRERLWKDVISREAMEGETDPLRKNLRRYLPPSVVDDDEIYQILRSWWREINRVGGFSWEDRNYLEMLINQAIERLSAAGISFKLRRLAEGAMDVAERTKIPTAAIVRLHRKGESPRLHLAVNQSFLSLMPISAVTTSLILVSLIMEALRDGERRMKVNSQLASGGAPIEYQKWFNSTFQKRKVGFRDCVEALVASGLGQMWAEGIAQLLRYSRELFDFIREAKDILQLSPALTEDAIRQGQISEEDAKKLVELLQRRKQFIETIKRNFAELQRDPDLVKRLVVAATKDAQEAWFAVSLHEILHLYGEHTSFPIAEKAIKGILEFTARRLVEIAKERGRAIKLPLPRKEFKVDKDTEISVLENLLINIAEQALSGVSPAQGLGVYRRLFLEALNIYFDLVINNAVYEYLASKSPLGLLYSIYRFVFPHTFGLPLLSEKEDDAHAAQVHREYMKAVGEELASRLVLEIEKPPPPPPPKNGGNGGNGKNGEDGENGENGEDGEDGENGGRALRRVLRRIQGEGKGKERGVFDWQEDENEGRIVEKEEKEEKEEERKGKGEEGKEGEGEEEREEMEGKGKGREEERKEEARKEAREEEEVEEREIGGEEEGGLEEDELPSSDSLRQGLTRSMGTGAGKLLRMIGMPPPDHPLLPPPWHQRFREVLTHLVGWLPPVAGGEEIPTTIREQRGVEPLPPGESGVVPSFISMRLEKRVLNVVIIQDVSGSMNYLYDRVVKHILGWFESLHWVGRKIVLGATKQIEVNVVFMPIDEVIHRIGVWHGGDLDSLRFVGSETLTGIMGGGTDILGVGRGLGLYHFLSALLDSEYRNKVARGIGATIGVKEDERGKIVAFPGEKSERALVHALQRLGLIDYMGREGMRSCWVFLVASDMETPITQHGGEERIARMVELLNRSLPQRYAIFFLIYNTGWGYERKLEELKATFGGAQGMPIPPTEGMDIISAGVYAIHVDAAAVESVDELAQSKLAERPVEEEMAEVEEVGERDREEREVAPPPTEPPLEETADEEIERVEEKDIATAEERKPEEEVKEGKAEEEAVERSAPTEEAGEQIPTVPLEEDEVKKKLKKAFFDAILEALRRE